MDQPVHLTPCHMTTVTGRIVNHALYEFSKGIRSLFMITMDKADLKPALSRLSREAIAFHVHEVGTAKVNLFFGKTSLIDCVRAIVRGPLYELTPHEDFMLGTLLGYDREQQCRRFLERAGMSRRLEPADGRTGDDPDFEGDRTVWRTTTTLC